MLEERTLKDMLYQEFARIGKCLSSPKRLEILDLLTQSPKSVESLAKGTGMSVANVSQHLQILHNARLVKFRKQGNFVIYKLGDSETIDFLNSLHKLSEKNLVQVQQIKEEFLNKSLELEGITLLELKERMDNGEILLLDVRPKEEYDVAHIDGAVSIPIEELEQKLSILPENCNVVAYCRGPFCLMAVEAVTILKTKGINAIRLENSVHDWEKFMSETN
ncbi:MAG: ArsR family transcriptional regulator [Bacillales bacterium]|jgi:rhodanese-related sulfurtransferase/Fe2+ or Zn2+ uptake regulation protein|nr:ArsR family transcriptional regulator [Bacillales bacterium]